LRVSNPSAPTIAIPTTAGTGTEATRNAVLAVPERGIKVSLRSPFLLPRLAIVDPELTYGLPPELTATSGLDALTQLIEPFLSNGANPMTDALCREGIGAIARLSAGVGENGGTRARRRCAREPVEADGTANASLRVHGFAGPIWQDIPGSARSRVREAAAYCAGGQPDGTSRTGRRGTESGPLRRGSPAANR
jgi:alcohol dehydrogenase class IV